MMGLSNDNINEKDVHFNVIPHNEIGMSAYQPIQGFSGTPKVEDDEESYDGTKRSGRIL